LILRRSLPEEQSVQPVVHVNSWKPDERPAELIPGAGFSEAVEFPAPYP
jgi:hypothetical protein